MASSEQRARIALYGIKNIKILTPRAIKFGNKDSLGIPSGMKLDQVKLPRV